MITDSEVLRIVEDHALMVHAIDSICTALDNGTDMPNFVPIMNDALVTDQIGKICEHLTTLRRKLV